MTRSEIATHLGVLLAAYERDALAHPLGSARALHHGVRALADEIDAAIDADAQTAREREEFGTADFHDIDDRMRRYL